MSNNIRRLTSRGSDDPFFPWNLETKKSSNPRALHIRFWYSFDKNAVMRALHQVCGKSYFWNRLIATFAIHLSPRNSLICHWSWGCRPDMTPFILIELRMKNLHCAGSARGGSHFFSTFIPYSESKHYIKSAEEDYLPSSFHFLNALSFSSFRRRNSDSISARRVDIEDPSAQIFFLPMGAIWSSTSATDRLMPGVIFFPPMMLRVLLLKLNFNSVWLCRLDFGSFRWMNFGWTRNWWWMIDDWTNNDVTKERT